MATIEFWKDKTKKLIDPTLFSTQAEQLAIKIAEDCIASRRRMNKPTQIRKFYDEVVRMNLETKSKSHQWEDILPLVHMITAKAAYAKGRELITDNFLDFIRSSVTQIERPEDLNVFANFFEAFIGFYKMHSPVK